MEVDLCFQHHKVHHHVRPPLRRPRQSRPLLLDPRRQPRCRRPGPSLILCHWSSRVEPRYVCGLYILPVLRRCSVSRLHTPLRLTTGRSALSRAHLVVCKYELTPGYASGPQPVAATDPKLIQAQSLLEDGTRALEDGDLPRAKGAYEESIKAMPTSGAWFNLGVVEYQLSECTSGARVARSS